MIRWTRTKFEIVPCFLISRSTRRFLSRLMDFGIALGEVSFNHQGFVNGDGCTRGRSPIAWELVAVDGNCSVPSFSDSRYFTGTGYNI